VDIKETQSVYSQGFVNASTLATMFLESGESEKTVNRDRRPMRKVSGKVSAVSPKLFAGTWVRIP
jgi:hypothetical protein